VNLSIFDEYRPVQNKNFAPAKYMKLRVNPEYLGEFEIVIDNILRVSLGAQMGLSGHINGD
jgi:hypothetical protein